MANAAYRLREVRAPNTQFAVRTPLGTDTSEWVTVGLDGCDRLSTSTGALRQATSPIESVLIAR